MKTNNTTSEQQNTLMRNWLTEYPTTSMSQMPSLIRAYRMEIVKAMFNHLRVDKFSEMQPDHADALLVAIGAKPAPAVWNPVPKIEPIFGEPIQTLGSAKISPLEAKRREMLQKRLDREQAELKADFDDRAWTVQAAYKPHLVFVFIKQGIHKTQDDIETLRSQHSDAHMYLEPEVLIGNLGEVRAQASKLFTGQGKGDVLIRVVTKESK